MKAASTFEADKIRRKYAKERDKRLNAASGRQYRLAKDYHDALMKDLWPKVPIDREALDEDLDVLVVGGGMSGIMTAGRVIRSGITNVRLLERGGDFGGTWYWNRYPGAACDTESYIYMPLLDETGYVPRQKYSGQPELQSYLRHLADTFDVTPRALFNTKAESFTWDEPAQRWLVRTDEGDTFRARFIALCAGSLSQPKLPSIEGIDTFKGKIFLNSRWDYDYTGGSAADPQLTKLRDKRVAMVGTGCSAVQAVPHLANWAEKLYVFQRTPSMVNFRGNGPTDPKWAETLSPGWQQERMNNFEDCLFKPREVAHDLVADGWTAMARSMTDFDRANALLGEPESDLVRLMEVADFMTMEEFHRRVEEHVSNPTTAEALKAYYNVNCKRPTFHDEYLPAFNKPSVQLIDTGGRGIERITPDGIVVGEDVYEVDCIIFATGFEAFAMSYVTGEYTITGAGGQTLEDKWSKNFVTLHGVTTHGFPNMVLVGHMRDGGGSTNANFPLTHQATYAAALIKKVMDSGATSFDVKAEAEQGWRQTMRDKAPPIHDFLAECTPGYLNNEGHVDDNALRLSIYGGGSIEYAEILKAWREGDGAERDLELKTVAS